MRDNAAMPSSSCSGRFHPRARLPQSWAIFESDLLGQNLLPDLKIAGNAGFTIRPYLQAGKQHQQGRGLTKDRPGGKGLRFGLAKGLVETPEARRCR